MMAMDTIGNVRAVTAAVAIHHHACWTLRQQFFLFVIMILQQIAHQVHQNQKIVVVWVDPQETVHELRLVSTRTR